jgi:rare lipoprotein A
MRTFLISILIFLCSFIAAAQQLQEGKASFYAKKFEGRKTASGQKFSNSKMTAAHKKLPFGTKVKVTNKRNGKSVIVTINDRLPKKSKRSIDLSQAAARELGFIRQGVTTVTIEVLPSGSE